MEKNEIEVGVILNGLEREGPQVQLCMCTLSTVFTQHSTYPAASSVFVTAHQYKLASDTCNVLSPSPYASG